MVKGSLMTKLIKNPPANTVDKRDLSSIPGSGRSPGEGNGLSLKAIYARAG